MTKPVEALESSGGCLCGAVRYKISTEPLMVAICHCRHCRRQSGSAFSVVGVISNDAYHQQGETKVFRDTGDTGLAVNRHFCGRCGSPIVSVADAFPGVTIVKAGTLDQPDRWVPTQEAYCASALPWLGESLTRQCFDRSNVGDQI